MQVQSAQHCFRPLGVSPTMSFLAVYADLFKKKRYLQNYFLLLLKVLDIYQVSDAFRVWWR
jgi:hypothetical protein